VTAPGVRAVEEVIVNPSRGPAHGKPRGRARARRLAAALSAAGALLAACGGGGASSSGPPSDCAGSILTGDHPGEFVCYAVARYYTKGVWVGNTLVQALNNASEKTHVRPAGVTDLGIQVEIAGEALAGTYTDVSMPQTRAYVDLDDGRAFDQIVEMTLTLENTRLDHEESSNALASRVFEIHGSVSFTVADQAGEQISVSATF
jgi:hypothetical protein